MTTGPQLEAFRDAATGIVSYLVLCPECGECAALDIDERGDVEARLARIVTYVRRNGLTLRWLIDTRRREAPGEWPARQLQQMLGGHRVGAARSRPAGYDLQVADGDELPLGVGGLRVLQMPGVASDSLCYQIGGRVFVGDLLGLDAAARPVLGAAGTAALDHLLALAPATQVWVGVSRVDLVPLSIADLRRAVGEGIIASPAGPAPGPC